MNFPRDVNRWACLKRNDLSRLYLEIYLESFAFLALSDLLEEEEVKLSIFPRLGGSCMHEL